MRILGGQFEGAETDDVNRLSGSMAQDKLFSAGDNAFVVVSHSGGEITTVYMTDHFRLDKEAILARLFLQLLLFARGTGLRAILPFVDTILLMWKILVPSLLKPRLGLSRAGDGVDGADFDADLQLGSPFPCGGVQRSAGHSGDGGAGRCVYGSVPDPRCGHGIQREPALRGVPAPRRDKDLRRVDLSRLLRRSDGPAR